MSKPGPLLPSLLAVLFFFLACSPRTGLQTAPEPSADSGTAAVLGGMVAALPCAIFGGMVGDFIGGDPDGNGTPGRALAYSLIGLTVGGVVCGSVGAILGSLIPKWRLEFARSGGPHDQVQ